MTDSLVMNAAGLEKKKYPGLKMPSPEFNLSRLREKKPTGLLSRVERKGRVGIDQVLVNELGKPEDLPFAFAVVSFGAGQKFAGIGALPPAVAEGLDEFTRREFQSERSFWYHPFTLVKDFPKPIPMSKPAAGRRFASDVNVGADRAEPATAEKWDGVPDPFIDDDGRPKQPGEFSQFDTPMEKYAAVVPGASSPWRTARLEASDSESAVDEAGELGALRGLDEILLAQRVGIDAKDLPVYKVLGTVLSSDGSSEVARAVEAGDPVRLREMKAAEIQAIAETLRLFHRAEFEGKSTTLVDDVSREDVLNAYVFVVRELLNRGETAEPKREIDSEAMDLEPGLFSSAGKQPVEGEVRFLTYDDLREFSEKDDIEKGLRPPWGSQGGKRWSAKVICRYIPPHKKYVEAFAGGAAVFWNREKIDGVKDTIADLDDDIMFAFRFIRDCRDTDLNALNKFKLGPDKPTFDRLLKVWKGGSKGLGKVARFHAWMYVRRYSYGRKMSTFNAGPGDTSLTTVFERIPKLRERLQGVSILSQTWTKTIRDNDGPETFFYLDPPYPDTDCTSLSPGGKIPTYEEIRDVVKSIKGNWLLSLDYSSKVRKVFDGLHFKTVETRYGNWAGTGLTGKTRKEYLISNNPFRVAKKSNDDGRTHAPTHPSGERQGRRIHLLEVLDKIRPFRYRQDAITIVGGLANRGWTDNDIDVLIKGPIDEDTLHVLKFRFGRMLGPELSQRVQFLSDSEFGGPFTDHIPLGNLTFETEPEFQVKEMRGIDVEKQDDPLQDLPLKPGKRDAVIQAHARGRTVHLDFRIAVRDYLIGWTFPAQIEGAIKEPITTVAQLKAITRNYNVETGNKFLKPMLAPKALFASPKSRQPLVWLKVEDRVFPPGTVGATKEFPGIITVIDRPKVEFGRQSPRFHEYFITDSKLKDGLWFVRMLVGEAEDVPEAEVGRVSPAGEIFWKYSISKQFLPSILKPRTVERKVMPPDGWSWIPQSLERDVPAESKYWTKKGAEARKVRDALVEEKTFTEKTVGLVDGEFRLVLEKRYVVNDGVGVGLVQKQPKRTAYVLSRQSFRGPIVVRAGFSKVFWWLVLDKPGGKGVWAWRLQTDPLGGEERISAVEAVAGEARDKALLELSGDQPPGSRFNPTKATPSDVQQIGDGRVELLEAKAGFLRLRFTSGPLKGVWSLVAEEPGSQLWELSSVTGPGRTIAPEKVGAPSKSLGDPEPIAGAVPVRDSVQIWDPGKKRPDMDRTDLRPLADFAPMKPREGFLDPNKLIDDWATPEIVQAGIDVEPKLNGLRTVAQVDGSGRTFIYFEDSREDRSKILPGVAAEVKALGEKIGPFILDTELVDFDEDGNAQPRRTLSRFTGPVKPQDDSRVKLNAFRLVYGLGRNWTADPRSDARPALEKFFEKGGRLDHIQLLPFKKAKSVDDIPSLIKWASGQPGGEGAMFKMHEATYTLGRFTSSWSKLKLARTVRAIVVEKIPKKPAPGQKAPSKTFVYRCGVGPIPKKDLDGHGGLVKIREEWYTEIGKTFATNVQARVGQTLEVQATEFLVDLSVPKKTVHWFTPVVTERVDARPSTFGEVVDGVFEHEIKQPVEKLLDGPIRLLKAEQKSEERFVLGIVSEPRTDSQEDFATKSEIRKACHEYMEFYRGTGLMHRERLFGGRVRICECWFQRGDTEINGETVHDGSWVMAWRIVDDALWKDVKAGKLTGFSIQGSAVREPVK